MNKDAYIICIFALKQKKEAEALRAGLRQPIKYNVFIVLDIPSLSDDTNMHRCIIVLP